MLFFTAITVFSFAVLNVNSLDIIFYTFNSKHMHLLCFKPSLVFLKKYKIGTDFSVGYLNI